MFKSFNTPCYWFLCISCTLFTITPLRIHLRSWNLDMLVSFTHFLISNHEHKFWGICLSSNLSHNLSEPPFWSELKIQKKDFQYLHGESLIITDFQPTTGEGVPHNHNYNLELWHRIINAMNKHKDFKTSPPQLSLRSQVACNSYHFKLTTQLKKKLRMWNQNLYRWNNFS